MHKTPAAWSYRGGRFEMLVYAINMRQVTSIQDAQAAVVMEPACEICSLLQWARVKPVRSADLVKCRSDRSVSNVLRLESG
jgi:hypothetical protein